MKKLSFIFILILILATNLSSCFLWEEDALEFNTGASNFRKVEVDGFIKATFDGAGLHFID